LATSSSGDSGASRSERWTRPHQLRFVGPSVYERSLTSPTAAHFLEHLLVSIHSRGLCAYCPKVSTSGLSAPSVSSDRGRDACEPRVYEELELTCRSRSVDLVGVPSYGYAQGCATECSVSEEVGMQYPSGTAGSAVADKTKEGLEVDGTSGQVVLVCEECGEKTVLDGPISAWRQDSNAYGCECGELLTPADRLEAPASDDGKRL
jgi:hypothetical protein